MNGVDFDLNFLLKVLLYWNIEPIEDNGICKVYALPVGYGFLVWNVSSGLIKYIDEEGNLLKSIVFGYDFLKLGPDIPISAQLLVGIADDYGIKRDDKDSLEKFNFLDFTIFLDEEECYYEYNTNRN